MKRLLLLSVLCLCACLRPQSLQEGDVLRRIHADYRQFFPAAADPDLSRDAGLLRPRFGLPAIVPADEAEFAFDVDLLQRGPAAPIALALVAPQLSDRQAATCLQSGEGPCYRLVVTQEERVAIAEGAVRLRLRVSPLPGGERPHLGAYDLYVTSAVDPPMRAPRAVFATRPLETLRIAHLSDIHIGKGHGDLLPKLRQVIADVNARAPDLVIITGDIANVGYRDDLMTRARAELLQLQPPVLAVPGNHDLGFDRKTLLSNRYGPGWATFARAFHPELLFSLQVGGWSFIGFDSGSSVISPRVLTRGLAPASLAALSVELQAAERAGQRGVVLFSHAPSRASLFSGGSGRGRGSFGRMRAGVRPFEEMLLAASNRLRVIHLSGHTHWSDVYEASPQPGPARFSRWPAHALSGSPRLLTGRVALITVQAAAHTTFRLRQNAGGHGFAWLELTDAPRLSFVRYRL
jgi:hypothetical protein